jgi:hypothetical protein
VPDRNLLSTVCCWLDRRRLVTTELYVVPPTYRRVALADENRQLKRIVADQALNLQVVKDLLGKKW